MLGADDCGGKSEHFWISVLQSMTDLKWWGEFGVSARMGGHIHRRVHGPASLELAL